MKLVNERSCNIEYGICYSVKMGYSHVSFLDLIKEQLHHAILCNVSKWMKPMSAVCPTPWSWQRCRIYKKCWQLNLRIAISSRSQFWIMSQHLIVTNRQVAIIKRQVLIYTSQARVISCVICEVIPNLKIATFNIVLFKNIHIFTHISSSTGPVFGHDLFSVPLHS